jgi:dTDP-4-amino-4,6-dideoxygalactose transaminase
MITKRGIEDLALFNGKPVFALPRSTSNLLQPNIEKFLEYSKVFYEQGQYTNNGPNVRLLEKRLADFHEVSHCVTFNSGFWALALTMSALAIENRSEVVMPSLTYRRMADIAAWVPLKPRFCEVDPTTLAMTRETVEPCINEETALILGVHPIVNGCDVEGLEQLSSETGIHLLFDSVESVYEGVAAGKVGKFGCAEGFSLHACKLLNGFGGGYITTNHSDLAKKLAILRGFGFSGLDNVVLDKGMNAKLNEIHAAMALSSLDEVDAQVDRNRARYQTYRRRLAEIPGLRLVEFDERYPTGYKNIVVELRPTWPLSRDITLTILNAENILARSYYAPPLHRKVMAFPHVPADLPVTDQLAEVFINLPCGHQVSLTDIEDIVTLLEFMATHAHEIREKTLSGNPV